jgi:hypothetical protein
VLDDDAGAVFHLEQADQGAAQEEVA